MPLSWAATQNNLGLALTSLGERESGTARLEEAVVAYREALKESPREKVPFNWARTQNNLGLALTSLGKRESGTARLEEAVSAYREALKESPRQKVPLNWAATQNNLGNALANLGERESGTARLEEAASAYDAALVVFRAAKADYYVQGTERNLDGARNMINQRRDATTAAGAKINSPAAPRNSPLRAYLSITAQARTSFWWADVTLDGTNGATQRCRHSRCFMPLQWRARRKHKASALHGA